MTDQRCGTCRHYEPSTGRWGRCCWRPTTPTPWWLTTSDHLLYTDSGTDCPTWEATDE